MNTATQIDIYNMALATVGNSKFVQSLDEQSQQVQVCNVFWASVRDQCLQDFPWNFAMRYNQLQLIDKTVVNWKYCFGYPNDCLSARLILPTPDVTDQDLICFWTHMRSNHRIPFAVIEDEANGGLAVACNLDTPTLVYTAQIKELTLWSPQFVAAVSLLLATKIIAPLSSNPKYTEITGKAYEAALLKAGASSLNEGANKRLVDSDFLTARD
jgi:hypothetical protein